MTIKSLVSDELLNIDIIELGLLPTDSLYLLERAHLPSATAHHIRPLTYLSTHHGLPGSRIVICVSF